MCGATKRFVVPTEAPVWGALLAGGFLGWLYQLALTGAPACLSAASLLLPASLLPLLLGTAAAAAAALAG